MFDPDAMATYCLPSNWIERDAFDCAAIGQLEGRRPRTSGRRQRLLGKNTRTQNHEPEPQNLEPGTALAWKVLLRPYATL